MENVAILGTGIYLPERVVSNLELEETLGLEFGFIESRTGIKQRRWANEVETLEYMASEAVINAVKDAGITKVDNLVIARDLIATRRAYSLGLPIIQRLSGAGIDTENCYSIDVSNYCPGFVHGLNIAQLMVQAGQAQNIVVVGSTRYNDIINTSKDFNQQFQDKFDFSQKGVVQYSLGSEGQYQPPVLNAFLWGCGAGAVVVGKSETGSVLGFRARGSQKLHFDSYGIGESLYGKSFASLDGKAIYKYAITEVPRFVKEFLGELSLSPEQINAFIPHQPNPRILGDLAKRIEIPSERILVSCDTLGNMIGASVPITYHQARKSGRIKSGNIIMLCSFGDSYLTTSGLVFKEK